MLELFNLEDIIKCEIRTTDYSWYLKIDTKQNLTEINIEPLQIDETLVYLEINQKIYQNNLMIDKINSIEIKYSPKSFRQLDANIKKTLYDILKTQITSRYLYLIGGEMMIFAKLLTPIDAILYTDFESIYQDAQLNLKGGNINLIDYNRCELQKTSSNYHLIANTSKSGLGTHLGEEILNLNLDLITIISCNKKSFQRDYKILKVKYKIDKIFEIKTNYEVCIYFLSK